MLSYLDQRKVFLQKQNEIPFIGGKGALITPESFGNLLNWFVNDLTSVAPCLVWKDHTGAGTGTCVASTTQIIISGGGTKAIVQLNGHDVIDLFTNSGGGGFPSLIPANNTSYTYMGILRAIGAGTAPPAMLHRALPSSGQTAMILMLGGGGNNNNLQLFVRSDNGQTNNLDGGLFVGQGWKIVCWQFDFATKTSRLILDGNIISNINAAMNTFTWGTPNYVVGNNGVGSAVWNGSVGEFFGYSFYRTNSEINQLGSYLSSKYALTWTAI